MLLAWGFGRYAPEASVGMGRDPKKALSLRCRRREALAPAPSTKKSAPYDSNPALAGPSPQAGHLRVFTPEMIPWRLPTLD